jgi:transposase
MNSTARTIIGVGLDTARYGHHVTFLREDRNLAAPAFHFAESAEGYAKLEQAMKELHERYQGPQFHIRVDAAGQYANNLRSYLESLSFDKVISCGEPKRNKDYRNVHFPKRKADEVESHACARFAVVERPKETPRVPDEFLHLREVLSALQAQTKRTTRLVNQLHNRLSRAFPELATVTPDLATVSVLNLLKKYPTAQKIAAAKVSSLKAIQYLRHDKAKQIHQAAGQSTASLKGPVIEGIIQQLVAEIRQSLKSEKDLENLLKMAYDVLPDGNHKYVQSIAGIGKVTAAALVASIVDIERFATADSLVNFFGLFPEENTSGLDRRGNPVPAGTMQMCQKGNDLVRKLLYMSCLVAIKDNVDNPAIRALYARKRAENKRGDVSLGHCMRKMLHLVFAVWTTGKPFDPTHYPWAATDPNHQEEVTEENTQKKKAAGRKGQSPNRKAVTAARTSVPSPSQVNNPQAATEAASVSFRQLREQITIEQVLRHLGHFDCLRGNSKQLRGPCPVHQSSSPTSQSFSVNLKKHAFQCFASKCGAAGNALDLWAAVHRLALPQAAQHMAETFGIQPE